MILLLLFQIIYLNLVLVITKCSWSYSLVNVIHCIIHDVASPQAEIDWRMVVLSQRPYCIDLRVILLLLHHFRYVLGVVIQMEILMPDFQGLAKSLRVTRNDVASCLPQFEPVRVSQVMRFCLLNLVNMLFECKLFFIRQVFHTVV